MTHSNDWYIKYAYALAAIVLTIYAMITAKAIVVPFLFAIFISILLTPLAGWLEKYRISRVISSLVAITVAVRVLFGVGFFFYTQMTAFVNDSDTIIMRLEELLFSVDEFLSSWFAFEGEMNLESIVVELVGANQANIASLSRGISSAASVITNVFLDPVFIFFILLFISQLNKLFILSY